VSGASHRYLGPNGTLGRSQGYGVGSGSVGMRLLVVDDDAVFREELATLLSDEGHQVEAVSSGAKAIEALEAAEYDAIFSDVRMPRMNGMELLRQVRERWPRVYVVMITGFGTVEAAVEAMKLGAFDYVRKPFRSEAVERIVSLIQDQRAFSTPSGGERDPVRLAEKWAKAGHEVLLLGASPRKALAGVTVADLPAEDSPAGLKDVVLRFVESHPRPAVIVAGVERLFATHRAEDVSHVLSEIVQKSEGKGPIAVGFDPGVLPDSAVLQVRAGISAVRVQGTLGALANPLRRHILRRLADGPTSFTEVMRAAGIDDSPKLSFHLRTLQEEGLISHSSEAYHLTATGKEAVRVLHEVDELQSAEEGRVLIFPTTRPPPPR
jgi:CheY-like chemotaxis protein/DNA-binding HxlR family transcriptional regulator